MIEAIVVNRSVTCPKCGKKHIVFRGAGYNMHCQCGADFAMIEED